MATKIRYVLNGQFIEKEGDLLDLLGEVRDLGVKGASFSQYGGEWSDVDKFMDAGRRMFAPISDEEAQRRQEEHDEYMRVHYPNGFTLEEIKPLPITYLTRRNERFNGQYLNVMQSGNEQFRFVTDIPHSETELFDFYQDGLFEKFTSIPQSLTVFLDGIDIRNVNFVRGDEMNYYYTGTRNGENVKITHTKAEFTGSVMIDGAIVGFARYDQ